MSDSVSECRLLSATDNQLIDVTKEMIVGRGDQCDLIVKTGQTSRQHAKLIPSAEGLWVEDLKSSNGTFLNDEQLTEKVLAKDGDQLRFDTAIYTVQHPASAATLSDSDDTTFVPKKPATVEVAPAPKRDAVTPPSWAMQRQQSVDGTEILGGARAKKLMQDAQPLEKVSEPTLIGKSEPIVDIRFSLKTDEGVSEWEIGRAETAHIVINHGSVSTSHAQIVNDGARWKLVDLVSANGTFVNEVKGLTTYLKHGDLIRVGEIECLFLLPQAPAAAVKSSSTVVARQAPKKSVNYLFLGGLVIAIAALAAVALLR